MSLGFSYKHLYYFWVVAKEGGMSRAAERLGMAIQTVSSQVRELERSLGHALLKPAGRGVALTEAGHAALRQADAIFQLGEQLEDVVRDAASAPVVRLAVGISDGLPKLAVRRLLMPVTHEPNLRLYCHEDQFDGLLSDLALHRLDVVLADRPAPPNPSLKVYSHSLGASPLAWYAPEVWFEQAAANFPASLAQVPVLLPIHHSAVRPRIDQWFERQGLRPRIAGEFEDSALLATFGAGGLGVFPAAELMHEKLTARYELRRVGPCEGVEEQFFAIAADKKVSHPLVQKLLPGHAPTLPAGD
ncbi:LysR family transcriptional regulator [Paucibacter sp. DJ1R-11]|uniref:LysR family transcriptional regulator n=1 Tax=Paucibacter sp. DJ1R-11 TaxID=2893556 RepID=UPI0021E4BECB|nr:LysR family transcriptional regulator [Paucibacter sp. DJ1R-11]MCV2361913.1 LysR family transcriptional regulator [Paucibacter sp. DJ1R-11]